MNKCFSVCFMSLVKFQSAEMIVFDCLVQLYSCFWKGGFFFFSPFYSVMVEIASCLHLVLMTRSSLKMRCPYPLNVNIKAQYLFQKSCTVYNSLYNNGKYSIHYPSLKKQTGLRLYQYPFLYFLVKEHSVFLFLSADNQGTEDYFSFWQQ